MEGGIDLRGRFIVTVGIVDEKLIMIILTREGRIIILNLHFNPIHYDVKLCSMQ